MSHKGNTLLAERLTETDNWGDYPEKGDLFFLENHPHRWEKVDYCTRECKWCSVKQEWVDDGHDDDTGDCVGHWQTNE